MSEIRGAIRFHCGLCLYSTEVDSSFIFHANNEHKKEIGYWCRDCETFCGSPEELVVHTKNSCTKIKTWTFRCGVNKWVDCDFTTKDTCKFREHFRVRHRGVHLIPCKECNKLFTNQSCLILHIQNNCRSHEEPLDDTTIKKSKKSQNKSKAGKKLNPSAVKRKMPSLRLRLSGIEEAKKVRKCAKDVPKAKRISPRNNQKPLTKNAGKGHKRVVSFQCDLCPYSTKVDNAFIVHYSKEHTWEVRYWCRECGDVATSPPKLAAHIRDSCTRVKSFTFRCGVEDCDFVTKDTFKFREHIKIHHKGIHLIPCRNCKKWFTNVSCLILHIQKQCAKSKQLRKQELKTTLADTSDESKCSCSGTRYKSNQASKNKHADAAVESEHSNDSSEIDKDLKQKASCSEESEICVDEQVPVIASNNISFTKQQLMNDKKAGVRFHCGLCPYNTKADKAFLLHYEKEHKKESDYWCRECGAVVDSPNELAFHIRDNCTKVKSFTFRCGVENCNFSSEDTYKFRRHVKMRHAGLHLLPCKECHKLFTIVSCLILHMQTDCLKRRRLSYETPRVDLRDRQKKKLKRTPAKAKTVSQKMKKGIKTAGKGRKDVSNVTSLTPPKRRRISYKTPPHIDLRVRSKKLTSPAKAKTVSLKMKEGVKMAVKGRKEFRNVTNITPPKKSQRKRR